MFWKIISLQIIESSVSLSGILAGVWFHECAEVLAVFGNGFPVIENSHAAFDYSLSNIAAATYRIRFTFTWYNLDRLGSC